MKKIALLSAVLFSMTIGSAFAAFTAADTAGTLLVGTSPRQVALKLSKGVSAEYGADTTAGLGYVVGTSHSSGTKTYASSSGDSKIWSKDGTNMATPTTIPTGTASADFSGWTAL